MKYSHITYPRLVPDQYQSPVFQPLFKTWRYRYRKLLRATYNWNYLLYWCTPETHYVIMKDLICLEIPRGQKLFEKRKHERQVQRKTFERSKILNTDTVGVILTYV